MNFHRIISVSFSFFLFVPIVNSLQLPRSPMNDSLRCHSQCFIRILPDHFPFVILYGCHTSINKTIINLFYTVIWHSVPFFQIIMAIIINQPTSNRSVKEPLRFCGILLRSLEIAQDSGWWPAFQYLFETWKKKKKDSLRFFGMTGNSMAPGSLIEKGARNASTQHRNR